MTNPLTMKSWSPYSVGVSVLGMLVGAFAFVVAYPTVQPVIKGLDDMGKVTFPDVTGTSPWLWIAGLVGGGLAAIVLLSRRGKSTATVNDPATKPGIRVGSSS